MYRLPNQFKSTASQVHSAAGGGSTTTTCSCCVVTAAGASILTAIHFSGLRKTAAATAPISGGMAPPDSGAAPAGDAGRMLSGLFSILIATVVGAMFASVGGFALGAIMAMGTFVGIFALAYESAGLPSGKGIVSAIAAVLTIAICAAIEISLW
ncbi:hypothetical protein SAMN05421829_101274 [Aromatoleum tolulyticum]|uniref:Uncharacterized protein n=1 Tax=Aromatoleum tolulyticum TaxID=34027 RepID=A0A1N6NFD6_9RHOO|nr:hypothetical protein [Aromatoleum tolulyticum]SIP90751.1 hypothetical protein SAMN05421829_101274 [Aromatoleum tolulyticum]